MHWNTSISFKENIDSILGQILSNYRYNDTDVVELSKLVRIITINDVNNNSCIKLVGRSSTINIFIPNTTLDEKILIITDWKFRLLEAQRALRALGSFRALRALGASMFLVGVLWTFY